MPLQASPAESGRTGHGDQLCPLPDLPSHWLRSGWNGLGRAHGADISRGAAAAPARGGPGSRRMPARVRAQLLSCLLLSLLRQGRGDPARRDLADEGHYLYLDEDGPLEVLAGPARCQDTYRDWISLYCWAPFHAALAATPEEKRCCWDHIGSIYSELSNCTELLAEVLACPWPSSTLDAFFLQIHAEYFSGCAGAGPPVLGGLPPGLATALAVGLGCLVPLAVALTLSRADKAAPKPPGSSPAPPRAEQSASLLRDGSGTAAAGADGGRQ
ncbi:uncharacterized protein LOC134151049 [Rhea pennata]|uniref:uncharacterized protein LOC134151049 n=1 Tax=Rhea pennata TaxID=8795 RepID=UPI002E275F0D